MSDPRWPDDDPDWPEHDLRQPEVNQSAGTDASPPSGDEPEHSSDPPAPEESPVDRPGDERRWDEPRWDDSPWEAPRWADPQQPDQQQPDQQQPDQQQAAANEPQLGESQPPTEEGQAWGQEEATAAEQTPSDEWADQPAESGWQAAQPDEAQPAEPMQWQAADEGSPADAGSPWGSSSWDAGREEASTWDASPQEASPDQPVVEATSEWVQSADPESAEPEGAEPEGAEPESESMESESAVPAYGQPVDFRPTRDELEPEVSETPEPEPTEPEPTEPELTEPEQPAEVPVLAAGEATTAFGGGGDQGWDPRLDGERRRPTTAEQAVPWMIGVILALAGIVIVLLALIFTFPGGLSGDASPSPTASAEPSEPAASSVAGGSVEPTATADASTPTPEPTQGPSPTPVPEYGALEMIYLGRPSALAPIYLLNRDFSVNGDPTVLAQAQQGISRYAWSPDGRAGVAITVARGVALNPGSSARTLADDLSAVTFGWDSDTVYAVRITRDGANDRTEILEIDFVTAAAKTLATITYPHPLTAPDPALREAQFIDNGGLVRIYPMADGNLALWVLGAPATYQIDPGDGRVSNLQREPILWAPDGKQRIRLTENSNGTSVLALVDDEDNALASVQVTGLVSHIRWAGTNNEIVFTLGRLGSSGGVRQDLYVWDLGDGKAPMPLTSNGISFGAEWRGVADNWLP